MVLKNECCDSYFFLSPKRGSGGGDQPVLDIFFPENAEQIKTPQSLTRLYRQTREQHIVLISRHVRANENSMAAWTLRLRTRSVWASGMLWTVCPRGERMLTHQSFFKSQLPENWEDTTKRYCTLFPENNMITINWRSLFIRAWCDALVWWYSSENSSSFMSPPDTEHGRLHLGEVLVGSN